MDEVQDTKPQKYKWLKKLGIWTVVFFVAKGLLWLWLGKEIWQSVAEWFK